MAPSEAFYAGKTPEELQADASWAEVREKGRRGIYTVEVKLPNGKVLLGQLDVDKVTLGEFSIKFPVGQKSHQEESRFNNGQIGEWRDAVEAWKALGYEFGQKVNGVYFTTSGGGNGEFELGVQRHPEWIPGKSWRDKPWGKTFPDNTFDRMARGAAQVLKDQLGWEVTQRKESRAGVGGEGSSK